MKAETLLYLESVSVSFDGFKALNNLNLDVGSNEMRAIIGPNGAGKTTMMDVITGKTRPDEGRVSFRDYVLTSMDEADIATLRCTSRVRRVGLGESSEIGTGAELRDEPISFGLRRCILGRSGLRIDFEQDVLRVNGFLAPESFLGSLILRAEVGITSGQT